MTSAAPAIARSLALGAIHILGYVIAACAITAGIVYVVVVATGGQAVVSGLGFVQLPLALSLTYAGAFLLGCLTVAGMAFVVGDLAWRTRRGVTFARSVSRSAWLLAAILGVGSWLTRIVQTIAEQSGVMYPDNVDPALVQVVNGRIGWGVSAASFLPDGALLGLAIVLAVLAYIVQSGERLQRETEGLV
jgi:hypothetical protein